MKLLSFKEMQLSFRLCHPTHTTPYGFAKQPLPCAYITVSRYVRGRVGQQHRTQKKKKKEEQFSESPRVSPLLLSILRISSYCIHSTHSQTRTHIQYYYKRVTGCNNPSRFSSLMPMDKKKESKTLLHRGDQRPILLAPGFKKKKRKSQLLAKTDDQTLSAFECRSALWAASFISLLHIVTTPIRTRTSARLL